MASTLHISIPCRFEDKVLTIKALRLTASGETPEKAFLDCIKNTSYYTSLKTAKIINITDFKGRDFAQIEVPFSNTVYDIIFDIEPLPSDSIKKKQLKSFLTEVSAEEILKLGY